MIDSTLPEPLVEPGTCVPRNFQFMRLDVGRLLDSEFWHTVSFEARGVAMGLWLAAFRQTPGGSLPDNDAYLASLVGLGKTKAAVQKWLKIKEQAMHGFTLCRDGRWYHPVVVEEVLHIWNGRTAQEYRSREDNDPRSKDRERLRRWRAKQKEAKMAATGNETGETKCETPMKRINETIETLQERDKDKEEDKENNLINVSETSETETPTVTHTLPEEASSPEVSAHNINKDGAYDHSSGAGGPTVSSLSESHGTADNRENAVSNFSEKNKIAVEEKIIGSPDEKSFSENSSTASKTMGTGHPPKLETSEPKGEEESRELRLYKELNTIGVIVLNQMSKVKNMCERYSDEQILNAAKSAVEIKRKNGESIYPGYIAKILENQSRSSSPLKSAGGRNLVPPNHSLLPPLTVGQSHRMKL